MMFHSLNANCICILNTINNFHNIQKLFNDISKSELDDFDIIILDQKNSKNELPTITFSSQDVPEKFVIDFANPKQCWDYFPLWAIQHKYKYYWVIGDLVHYSGNWTDIFKKYMQQNSDLLTNGRGIHGNSWGWWKRPRNIYGINEKGYPRNVKKYQTAFLPFSRFSRKLVESGYESLNSGKKAFLEIFWPSICVKNGLKIGSFDSEDVGTFTWKPDGEYVKVESRNKLWYPVKKVENFKVNEPVGEFKQQKGYPVDLVLSCFITSYKWILEFEWYFDKIFLYFKNEIYDNEVILQLKQTHTVIIEQLPNVGRCDHTYLHHITKHWDNLNHYTMFTKDTLYIQKFTKGNTIAKHNFNNFRNFIKSNSPNSWYASVSYESSTFKLNSYNSELYNAHYTKTKFTLNDWCLTMLNIQIPNKLKTQIGGTFCIPKKHIYSNPLELYLKARTELSYFNNCEQSHFMERLWLYICNLSANYVNYDDINYCKAISFRKKIGIVLVTHGNNGIFVEQAIKSFLKHINDVYICVYVNESNDPLLVEISKIYNNTNIEWTFIDDQNKSGGLTGAWNKGIAKCISNRCETIIISNDDIFITESIKHILLEAEVCSIDKNIYFGPLTNNPGPNNHEQHSFWFRQEKSYFLERNNRSYNLNGFFMVFPKHSLLNNMFDNVNFFDPSFPFGGNECEWHNRFVTKGGKSMIVPKTFVYHYKLASWRNNKLNDKCMYSCITGGYETKINIPKSTEYDFDILIYTDSLQLIENSIKNNFKPFLVYHDNNSKRTQRMIKTAPHLFLPLQYNISIWIDGNCIPLFRKCQEILGRESYDLICWEHPHRNNVSSEIKEIIHQKLETKSNTDKICSLFKKYDFKDNSGLTETSLLLRIHKNIIQFSQHWMECINICYRDQVSFDFLIWLYKIKHIKQKYKTRPITKLHHCNPWCRKVIIV